MFEWSSPQIRACRAILKWTIKELSEKTDISESTLIKLEKPNGHLKCNNYVLKTIKDIFESTNRVIIPDDKTIILSGDMN